MGQGYGGNGRAEKGSAGRVEDFVTGGGEGTLQRAAQYGAVHHLSGDQPGAEAASWVSSASTRQRSGSPPARDDVAGQHDDLRVEHGDHGGETGCEAGGEPVEQQGYGPSSCGLRGLRGAGEQPGRDLVMGAGGADQLVVDAELPAQPGQHLGAGFSSWKPPAFTLVT